MNARLRLHRLLVSAAAVASLAVAVAAKPPPSDIVPPDLRQKVVDNATRLSRTPAPTAVPADVASPFSPAGFEKPDASEMQGKPVAAAPEAKGPVVPQTDRDVLEAVADKIPTTGTIIIGGKPLLISGTNRIEVGSRFTVVYNGQEYELELVAIERTTFTVRYRGEEFTRPIKIGKSP